MHLVILLSRAGPVASLAIELHIPGLASHLLSNNQCFVNFAEAVLPRPAPLVSPALHIILAYIKGASNSAISINTPCEEWMKACVVFYNEEVGSLRDLDNGHGGETNEVICWFASRRR